MRILMTADAVGGVWTYALELADALEPHGAEVVLATMGPEPSREQLVEAERSAVAETHVSSYALEWMDEPWHDVEDAGRWLLDLAGQLEPDVVHLNGFAHGALPWRSPVVVVGHSCVLSWWDAVRRVDPPLLLGGYREAVRRGLARADLVVAPTAAMLGELERLYGLTGDRRVIPNGRRAIPALEKEPFVLAAGRAWDDAKNLTALDRAAVELPWPVIVAGEGGAQFAHVQAHGSLPRAELDDLLGRASIFAAPALYEPFGLGPLEAASAGCALVLGDIASQREVWGDAAAFVDPRDWSALAAELAALAEGDSRRAELAARAQERARLYTPERMGDAYAAAYRELVPSLEAVA